MRRVEDKIAQDVFNNSQQVCVSEKSSFHLRYVTNFSGASNLLLVMLTTFCMALLSGCECQGGVSNNTMNEDTINDNNATFHNSLRDVHGGGASSENNMALFLLSTNTETTETTKNANLSDVSLSTVAKNQLNTDKQVAQKMYGNITLPSSPQSVSQMFVVGKPVHYDTKNWSNGDNKTILVTELPIIRANLTNIVDIDDNSLDYSSQPAIKYRYSPKDVPYLDLVDSEQFLEFGWYFANPDDSQEEKTTSVNHAKHIFNMARYLMGKEGEKLVTQMLHGQTIKDKKIAGVQVELAKCEFYSCMLIINKTLTPTKPTLTVTYK